MIREILAWSAFVVSVTVALLILICEYRDHRKQK